MARDDFRLPFKHSIQGASGASYEVIQGIGSGGTAATFLVVANSGALQGCLFALKVFRRLTKPERRLSFLSEFEFLRKHKHPSLMTVIDEGEYQNSHPFFVAEYLPQTLEEVIRGDSSSTVEKLAYAMQLLSGLAFLERLDPPVIHRDIKPQNVFLKGKSCILGDFGLMKRQIRETTVDLPAFKESVGVGMPYRYRTPDLVEYLTNGTPPTTRSDVFQLGLVLAELFNGKNPLEPAKSFSDPIQLEIPRPQRGKTSRAVCNLLENMLEIKSEKRQSAADLVPEWKGLFFSAVRETPELARKVF